MAALVGLCADRTCRAAHLSGPRADAALSLPAHRNSLHRKSGASKPGRRIPGVSARHQRIHSVATAKGLHVNYTLQRSQTVSGELAAVFDFFKSPRNLEA